MRPDGRTALYDALVEGIDHLARGSRARKVLVVVSDGGDNASEATLDSVLARARESNAAIYTLGIFDPEDIDRNPGVLKSLARATGGERFLPRSPGEMMQVCERIAREIRSGYTIGYVPPDRDGNYHRVRVDVQPSPSQKMKVRTRPGLFRRGPRDVSPNRAHLIYMTRDALLRWLERGLLAVGIGLAAWCAAVLVEARFHSQLPIPPASRKLKVTQTLILPGDKGGAAPAPAPSAGILIGRLEAPTVKMSATVLEGSDDGTLSRGAGHIEDTPFPGQPGNVGIAGHRDTVFRPLRNIKVGDPMQLTTSDRLYRYKISKTRDRRTRRRLCPRSNQGADADAGHLLSVRLRGARAETIHRSGAAGRQRTTNRDHHSIDVSRVRHTLRPRAMNKERGQDCSWPPRPCGPKGPPYVLRYCFATITVNAPLLSPRSLSFTPRNSRPEAGMPSAWRWLPMPNGVPLFPTLAISAPTGALGSG